MNEKTGSAIGAAPFGAAGRELALVKENYAMMGTKEYNKLVRDRIPDIISQNGGTAITKTLNDEEYAKCLKEKLAEEVQEFLSSDSVEELADIFQVILAILDKRGIPFERFEEMLHQKAREKGEFKDRLFLVCVDR